MSIPAAAPAVLRPPDPDMERPMLGACMEATACVSAARAVLPDPDLLEDPRHRAIYAALLALEDRGDPTDVRAVVDHLERTGQIEAAGGQLYVFRVWQAGAGVDPAYQARIVARRAAVRRGREVAQRLDAWLANPRHADDVPALLEAARDEITRALEGIPDGSRPAREGGWGRVDLSPVLDGTYQPPQPTVGARVDGVGLFYPSRGHAVASESEAGKTWLALTAAATELERGRAVVYLDFEDDAGGVVGRLLAMGAPADAIRDRFGYIRPEGPLTASGGRGRRELVEALGDLTPSLVVVDGVTEAMAMHGFNPLDNEQTAQFGRLLVRPLMDSGAAVVSLDHVTKDRETRGRYAIGAVHKLNGLNGAMYQLANREPIGLGRTGRSGLHLVKDRPARLRPHAVPSAGGREWFGDLVVTSDEDGVHTAIVPPGDDRPPRQQFRPTELMARVSDVLACAGRPLNKREVETRTPGRAKYVRQALEVLVDEGYVRREKSGNAELHALIRPFAEGDE